MTSARITNPRTFQLQRIHRSNYRYKDLKEVLIWQLSENRDIFWFGGRKGGCVASIELQLIAQEKGFCGWKCWDVTSLIRRDDAREKQEMTSATILNPRIFQVEKIISANHKCKDVREGLDWHLSENHYGYLLIRRLKRRVCHIYKGKNNRGKNGKWNRTELLTHVLSNCKEFIARITDIKT